MRVTIAGVFDEFWGVPLHPLAVHAPVVLVPVAAIVAVVLAVRSDWRNRIGWFMPAGVLALVAMLFVAKESGQAAADADNVFGDITEHQDLAETTFVLAIVWFVVTAVAAARDWQVRRSAPSSLSAAAVRDRDPIALGLAVVAAVAAIVTTVWLVRTGHAGSASRWDL